MLLSLLAICVCSLPLRTPPPLTQHTAAERPAAPTTIHAYRDLDVTVVVARSLRSMSAAPWP